MPTVWVYLPVRRAAAITSPELSGGFQRPTVQNGRQSPRIYS
jgi:hypothetical protein